MRVEDTDVGPIALRDDETLISAVPMPVVRPARLPDPARAMAQLTRVRDESAIGDRPPFAATGLDAGEGENFELFEALFGRDALLIARLAAEEWPRLPVTTFEALAALQGLPRDRAPEPDLYDRRLEEPGRIPHETRDPATDAIGFRLMVEDGWAFPYYHSDDATPAFVRDLARYAVAYPEVLARQVLQRDGVRRPLAVALAAGLRHALQSIGSSGLIESERPTRQRPDRLLAYPVWQDSPDAYFRHDGTLARGPVAVLDVQAQAFDALIAVARLVEAHPDLRGALGDPQILRARAEHLRAAVFTHLWAKGSPGYFVPGAERVDGELHRLAGVKSAMGAVLDSELLVGRAWHPWVESTVRALFEPTYGLATPWGIRTLGSVGSADRYRPDAYHNGTIWLFDNHVIARGLRRHGWHGLATWLDRRIVDACRELKLYPEHIRGDSVEEPRVTDYCVDVLMETHLGPVVNRVAQPPQLIQGWTLASYIDAQRCLARFPHDGATLFIRAVEHELLAERSRAVPGVIGTADRSLGQGLRD